MSFTTKRWLLRQKPYGLPVISGENSTFELKTTTLGALQDNQVCLKTVYLSNDPAQRSWISPLSDPKRFYVQPLEPGDYMRALGIGKVIESRSDTLRVDTLVLARTGWSELSIHDASTLTPLKAPNGLHETHFMGALGLPGFTAYYALSEILKLQKSDFVVVSAAAGAVGSMVVQIAKKVLGCAKVIGLAGSEEKCRWVESIGADLCLNYKAPTFHYDLVQATPNFVDVYFDNVGGKILDLMLKRMNMFGRIAACGTTSNYNSDADITGIKNFYEVIMMRIKILGFINIDWLDHLKEVTDLLVSEYEKGNLTVQDGNETVVDTKFEDIPRTWMMLFDGGNTGKLITRLVD